MCVKINETILLEKLLHVLQLLKEGSRIENTDIFGYSL